MICRDGGRKSRLVYSDFNNISLSLFFYWFALVVWQNVSHVTARTAEDFVIKVCLLFFLILCFFYYFLKKQGITKGVVKKALAIICFSLCLLVTLTTEVLSSNIFVTYCFPVLLLFLVYCIGDSFEVNLKQLLLFCRLIVAVDVYTVLYNLLFCFQQYQNAFYLESAYGNELTSFFVSNLEYGMYLFFGVVSCVCCLKYGSCKKISKLFYILIIVVFCVNIVLTYSRTTIAAMIAFGVAFVLLSKNKWLKISTALVLAVAALLIANNGILKRFIFEIVLKGNTDAGRGALTTLSIDRFASGNTMQKLFGFGVTNSRKYFEQMTTHESVHNGYLQVLMYFGLIILVIMGLYIIVLVVKHIAMLRKERFLGAVFLGLTISMGIYMLTTTAIIFNSSIDSFFLTMTTIIVPKYVWNSMQNNRFWVSRA